MNNLIDAQGCLRYGQYDEPVHTVNYRDYPLQTVMGHTIPKPLRGLLANQFHFAGIIGTEIMVGMAVVDLKYLANGFLYVYDRTTRTLLESKKLTLPSAQVSIRPTPANPESVFRSPELSIEIRTGKVSATARDILVDLTLQSGVTPLRLCTRAGYRGWVYTEKTTPIPVSGQVRYRGQTIDVGTPAYWGLMDWTTGYMRRDTCWNWAATATTLSDGRSLGLNFSCGANETSFTENAFWIDGRMTKVDAVNFVCNPRNLNEKWRITSYDKKVDLTFYPEAQRSESVNACLVKSKFTQFMGFFEGQLKTDTGETVPLKACPGWTEDHYAKW